MFLKQCQPIQQAIQVVTWRPVLHDGAHGFHLNLFIVTISQYAFLSVLTVSSHEMSSSVTAEVPVPNSHLPKVFLFLIPRMQQTNTKHTLICFVF